MNPSIRAAILVTRPALSLIPDIMSSQTSQKVGPMHG